jgi:mycothiol synthase
LYDTISAVTISIEMEHQLIVRNYNPHDSRDAEAYERLKEGAVFAHMACRPGYCVDKDLFLAEMEDASIVGFVNVLPEMGIGRVVLECAVDRKHSLAPIVSELVHLALQRVKELGANRAHVSLNSTNAKEAEVLSGLGFREVRRYHELKLELAEASLEDGGEPGWRFGRLKPGEEARLVEIENCCFQDTWGFNPNTVDYIAWELKVKGNRPEDIILFEEKGEVVGYCWPVTDSGRDSTTGKSKGRIYMLGVRPGHRGRGLGRELLLAGLRQLRDKGSEVVEITVDSQNTVAVELYLSLGFRLADDTLWYEKVID